MTVTDLRMKAGSLDVDDIYEIEDKDGVRFNWNAFPVTRAEEEKITAPLGCLYTPLNPREDLPRIYRAPFKCNNCSAVLNPFGSIDSIAKVWTCSLCLTRNKFQGNYDFSHVLEELDPITSSVEYVMVDPMASPLLFLYVIDLTLEEPDLEALKQKIIDSIDLHPVGAYIGLIVFDSNVRLYELGSALIPKMHVFKGSKTYSEQDVQKLLGIAGNGTRPFNSKYENVLGTLNRYFTPLSDDYARSRLITIISNLKTTPLTSSSQRPERCTGSALAIASGLMDGAFLNASGHVLLFIGGPCTVGQGKVVDVEKSSPIRSFNDIRKRNATHLKKAIKFYDSIASRASSLTADEKTGENTTSSSIYSINVFASSYDQPGIYEMKNLTGWTGGILIMTDSFTTNIFKETFNKVFELNEEGVVDMQARGNMTVLTSSALEVAGMIGNGTKVPNNGKNHSDVAVGEGFTNSWNLPMISSRHSYAVYFKVQTVAYGNERRGIPGFFYIQFLTSYKHVDGSLRLKVTTLKKATTNTLKLEENFDQGTAVVLMLRETTDKIQRGLLDHADVSQKVDEQLIHLCKGFGIYIKKEPSSFKLNELFSLLPQFVYNSKKSPILTNFNNTPDESTFYVDIFQKSNVDDSLTMIQPTLSIYTATDPTPQPVLLDSSSLQRDAVLLMDSFFYVVIHIGEIAAAWRDQELDREEFANVYEMLEQPQKDAVEIIQGRFPLPRYIITDQGKSQDRFLLSRLNPSNNDNGFAFVTGITSDGKEVIYTEDMSLNQYYMKLRDVVVKEH